MDRAIGRVPRVAMSAVRCFWLACAVFGFGFVASGCSSGHTGKLVKNPEVRPKAFGPPGKCYYLVSPQECSNQKAPGVPTQMPPLWLATYWPYYSSSNYFYQIPPEDDEQYAQALGNFASQDGQEIVSDASDGDWVDQDGNSWDGDSSNDPDSVASSSDGSDDSGGDLGDDGDDDSSDDDSGDDDGGGDDGGGDDGGGDD